MSHLDLQNTRVSLPSGDSFPTSTTLLKRVRSNDTEAWGRLVFLYTPLIAFWCKKQGLGIADRDAIVQEVFVAVYRCLNDFRPQGTARAFRGWLFVITRNKIYDHYRVIRQRAATTSDYPVEELSAPQPNEADESDNPDIRVLHVQRALDTARPHFESNTWAAFWAVTIEGRSPTEVAKELGIAPGTVSNANTRVLNRIRQTLCELDEPDLGKW